MGRGEKKEKSERGSRDEWEAIKIILDEQPSLKRRVLQKIRSIKARQNTDDTEREVSQKQTKEFLRSEQERTRGKK